MKTAEEKAKKYADDIIYIIEKGREITVEEIHDLAQKDYLAGYTEATRWRDPKVELPEEGVVVFVKLISSCGAGDEILYTSSAVVNDFYHSNDADPFGCEGYYPSGNGGRVRATVIGWRPIE